VTELPDFFTTARTMRAHREFSDTALPDALVERVLEAATYAPSAENTQPWVFVVVRDAAARDAIGALTRQAWERGGREYAKTRLSPGLFGAVDRGATGGVSNAPVLVVIGVDTSRCAGPALSASIFPAIENLLLAAHSLGLGSALTTLPRAPPRARRVPRLCRRGRGRAVGMAGEGPRPSAAGARRREGAPRAVRQPVVTLPT
jgi:nitroreductase